MSQPTHPAFRLPIGLLGMLALVLAIEVLISARRLDFTTVWADDWRQTAEAAKTVARGRDILCFGDSLVKFGVLPRVIEARTGLKAYNLAINAGTMPSAYFLLRKALAAGARPRAVVADFFPLMLPDYPPSSVRTYPDLASFGDLLDLARTSRDPGFLASTVVGKLLPSYQARFEIRSSVKAAFQGRRASPWPAQAAIWATWGDQLGAQPMPGSPLRPADDPALVHELSPETWSCDPINAAYLEKFLKLAESRHIPVFWLMPPLGPRIRERRLAQGTDLAYARLAREAQVRHPGLVILDARSSGYDASVHIDAIHLDRRGATVLSEDLATVIQAYFRGDRIAWVELPAYDGRTGEPAMVAESPRPSAR